MIFFQYIQNSCIDYSLYDCSALRSIVCSWYDTDTFRFRDLSRAFADGARFGHEVSDFEKEKRYLYVQQHKSVSLLAIVIYLVAMVLVGVYCSRKGSGDSSNEFYLGGPEAGPHRHRHERRGLGHEQLAAHGSARPGLSLRRGRGGLDRHRPGGRHLSQLAHRGQAICAATPTDWAPSPSPTSSPAATGTTASVALLHRRAW